MSKTREAIRAWTRQIDVTGKTVLDCGSGSPKCWVSHFVKGKPKDFKALDVKQKTSEEYPGLKIHYIRDLNDPITDVPQFDYVFCIETMEHCWNPFQVIENLSNFTKEKLFITAPFVYPLHDKPDMLRFTFQWFEKVLPEYGFREVGVEPRFATVGKEDLQKFYRKEGARMSKVTIQSGYGEHYFAVGYHVEARK